MKGLHIEEIDKLLDEIKSILLEELNALNISNKNRSSKISILENDPMKSNNRISINYDEENKQEDVKIEEVQILEKPRFAVSHMLSKRISK